MYVLDVLPTPVVTRVEVVQGLPKESDDGENAEVSFKISQNMALMGPKGLLTARLPIAFSVTEFAERSRLAQALARKSTSLSQFFSQCVNKLQGDPAFIRANPVYTLPHCCQAGNPTERYLLSGAGAPASLLPGPPPHTVTSVLPWSSAALANPRPAPVNGPQGSRYSKFAPAPVAP